MTATAYKTQTGFPSRDEVLLLWGWIQQQPLLNCDDYGPKSYDELWSMMRLNWDHGTIYHVVHCESGPVGMFGVQVFPRLVLQFHGVCFDPAIHGRGIAAAAIYIALAGYFEHGVRKAQVEYLAHNGRMRRFLEKLGFHHEGQFRNETIQNGQPIDVERMALFPDNLTRGV